MSELDKCLAILSEIQRDDTYASAKAAGFLAGVKDRRGGSRCTRCGFHLDHRPVQIPWELLERCPRCNAYDWMPPPIHMDAEQENA